MSTWSKETAIKRPCLSTVIAIMNKVFVTILWDEDRLPRHRFSWGHFTKPDPVSLIND